MIATLRWLLVSLCATVGLGNACRSMPAPRVTSGPATTTTLPPVTDPRIDAARLRAILVPATSLPAGFTAVTSTGVPLPKLLCRQPVIDTSAMVATAQASFDRATDKVHVTEVLVSFPAAADAKAVVTAMAGLVARCPRDGATSVSALQPPAIGEDVAGVQLRAPGRVSQVAVIHSGVIDALVVVAAPHTVPAGTFAQVVTAAGTALAVGTGG